MDEAFVEGAVEVVLGRMSTEEAAAVAEAMEEERRRQLDRRAQVLTALSDVLVAKRGQAIRERAGSGIEEEWEEDEEAYEGVDDANRHEEGRVSRRKEFSVRGDAEPRSTVFLNITRPFCDAAAARTSDMLVPTDDRAFALKKTPVGEMAPRRLPPPVADQQLQAAVAQRVAQPEGDVEALLRQVESDRSARVEAGERQIEDWLVESGYHAHMRAVFDDAARIGTGVMKGPFPTLRKRFRWDGEVRVEYAEIVPACSRVDVWNLYPDWPTCGEDIQSGRFVFEREDTSSKTLGQLLDDPNYFADQVAAVLAEGPKFYTASGVREVAPDRGEQAYESWYFYGTLERDDVVALGVDVPDEAVVQVPVMAHMVNDRIIKLALNPLPSGMFPYSVMPWSRRKGMPWGRGVSRLVRPAQRIVNAATRNMMDNAALAAGLILFLRREGITPVDRNWVLHGRKTFLCDESVSASKAVRDAFATVELPIRVNELMAIINFGLKMAEDVTGLPMLLQGQQGTAPDTVGGMTLLHNNATGVLRRIARSFDDHVVRPLVTMFYEWLQEYTTDERMRFEATVDVRGSSALVERDLQNTWIMQVAQFVQNPAFKINPAKWFAEYSRSVRFDPAKLQYTDEEWQMIASQPPPEDPRVTAARISAEGRVQSAQVTSSGVAQRAQMEAQGRVGAASVSADARRYEAEINAALQKELELQRMQTDIYREQLKAEARMREEVIRLASEEKLTADQLKTRLIELMAQTTTKRDLFAAEARIKAATGEGI